MNQRATMLCSVHTPWLTPDGCLAALHYYGRLSIRTAKIKMLKIIPRWRLGAISLALSLGLVAPAAYSHAKPAHHKTTVSSTAKSVKKRVHKPTKKQQHKAAHHQTGVASWYGGRFHGRRTANGERYNKFEMTAAHKTIPFGTWVEVTALRTGRKIVVRINDRGPFVRGRVIDLSRGSARKLGMHGVAHVRLAWPVKPPKR